MNTNRRSFIRKLGAGTSAALASAVAAAGAGREDDPSRRVSVLEEEQALRRLHQAFEQALDKGLHEDVIGMFTDDARVVFNGGVFTRRSMGVSRLYRETFPAWKTGRRIDPAPGFEPAGPQRDHVEVSADLRAATAVFPYSIQAGMPFQTESSLAAMARLHGEGVRTWWEGGLYRVDYEKDAAGRWKMSRLEYDTQSRADYRPGRSDPRPISVPRLAMRFPEDPHGPDDLI